MNNLVLGQFSYCMLLKILSGTAEGLGPTAKATNSCGSSRHEHVTGHKIYD